MCAGRATKWCKTELRCDQMSCVFCALVSFASCIGLLWVGHRPLLWYAAEGSAATRSLLFVWCRSLLSCLSCIPLERRLRCDKGFVCARRWFLLGCIWVSFVLYIGLFRVWYTSRKEALLRSDCVCVFLVGFFEVVN